MIPASRDGVINSVAKHSGGLELTWTDKDKAILSVGDGEYDYTFVEPSTTACPRFRLLHFIERMDEPVPPDRSAGLPTPTYDNLLITGDAMHVLDALSKIPSTPRSTSTRSRWSTSTRRSTLARSSTIRGQHHHSIWLTLLRDRLRQIKPLLAPNGSIWVHLDDAEMHRCRAVIDEELGPENFVGTVIWGKSDSRPE